MAETKAKSSTRKRRTSSAQSNGLSQAQRDKVLARAKSELPALEQRAEVAIKNLERIAEGLRPQRS